jgi:anti-sigma B factor antagonist
MPHHLTKNKKTYRIEIDEALNIYAAPALHSLFCSVLNDKKSADLDLSNAAAVDTCGVQLLMAFKEEMVQNGLTLTITGHSPELVRMLDLYGLFAFFGDTVRVSKTLKNELSLSYGLTRKKKREGG